MADQQDLERALRSFEHQASPRVKEAALGAFSRRKSRGRVLWSWRVPLPITAAGVALAATVAFMIGQQVGDDQVQRPAEASGRAQGAVEEAATVWTMAASDILADRTGPVGGTRGVESLR